MGADVAPLILDALVATGLPGEPFPTIDTTIHHLQKEVIPS
ncbi:hypothetical protein ANMWB30_23740 [Arthrobacter sp. MWB30]|nr:hypothetical protein ANMWB30_23740 [Arthrobacter sp. MWB30]